MTLIVGKEKKAYNLHKDLLCFYSDYSRTAFNGSFKEAAERKLELPGVETSLFEEFQIWLYTRGLQGPTDDCQQFAFLVNVWVLGGQHQIPLLQNQVMDELFAKLARTKVFFLRLVPVVYTKTMGESLLRKAVIEVVAWTMRIDEWDTMRSTVDWKVDSLTDLMLAINQARFSKEVTFPNFPKRDRCFFHVHGKDEHC